MTEIIVACIAFLGTVLGSLGGVVVSSKLTNFRLLKLEEKVSVHNNFAMRLPVLEQQIGELSARMRRWEEAK